MTVTAQRLARWLPARWPIVAAGFGIMLVSGVIWNSFSLVCGIGAQSCSSFALFTILGNWFRERATLLSMADSGSGIGAFLGLPLLLALMQGGDWRDGYLALAEPWRWSSCR